MASAATELLSPQGCEPSLAIGLDHDQQYDDLGFVEFLGLTTLNSLLQYVNWLVWEVCSVN